MWSTPEMRLREAGLDDVRVIAQFQTRVWAATYTGLVSPDYLQANGVVEREIRWRAHLESGARLVVLATLGPVVVGVASSRRCPLGEGPTELELTTLYVDAAHHGTGIAAKLLDQIIGQGPAAHLWVFEDNHRARAFYTKHRFTPDGSRALDRYTGVQEIRMTRAEQPRA